MTLAVLPEEENIQHLRQTNYNAEVIDRIDVNDELIILRVRPDHGVTSFVPGQYSVMGLGNWEMRVPGCQEEHLEEDERQRVLKRAYSFSCSMVDENGSLRRPDEFSYFEFYIVLVRQGEKHPPGLTPRLFGLAAGDRLFVGPKATGHYTLDLVQPDDNIVMAATGTGEAPHNAMVAQLLSTGHRGQVITVICVRNRHDLGYEETHRQLEQAYGNYRHLQLTTREPENLDTSRDDFIGKQYLQDYFDSIEFERDSGIPLDPQCTHVFLCGNPAMIGAPKRDAQGVLRFPKPTGVIEILSRRGFHPDERSHPGNIHYEKYW